MKKLIAIFLTLTMSLSLLVGCGGSDEASNKGNNSTNNEAENNSTDNEAEDDVQQEEERGEVTVSYDVTDPMDGGVMKCELTYNASVIETAAEIFDDVEPVEDLCYAQAEFFHDETRAPYAVSFIPGLYSALAYYEDEKESYENNDHYKDVIFSELTTQTVGSIETQTYTQKLVWEDDDTLDEQFWMIQFEEGIMLIATYGDEEALLMAQDALKDLLVKVTLNGKEPGVLENVYTLYDYSTGTPLYNVTFNPKVFAVDESCDPSSGEMILNYLDTSREYTQMIIHVNEFTSGEACFASEKYYSYGIEPYRGDDGTILETAGEIGETTAYMGLGLGKNSVHGYMFFAEMPDGNVITGNVPGSYVGDSLDVYFAFLTIQPVE